ncbi:cytochrome C [Sulfurimonas sp. HSL-1656]|uniref:cytochrome C n=1 Tax=Thiomicrolovo subterrani TaxID=3131934 RepID=UPI0031F7F7AB
MTTFGKLTTSALLGLGLLTTSLYADADKGQRLYQKKLKATCGMTGAVFAAKHTQMEWEEAKESGNLAEMMTEACPEGKSFFESGKFKSKFEEHLYDFVHDFASDSGNIPSC